MVEEGKHMKKSQNRKNERAGIPKVIWLSLIVSVVVIGVLLVLCMTSNKASSTEEDIEVTSDAYISGHSSYQNRNYGSSSYLYAGDPDSRFIVQKDARSLFYWDLQSTLPSDAKISRVELSLYGIYMYYRGSRNVYFHELTTSFVENQVTWKRPMSGKTWNGGDYKDEPFDTWFSSGRQTGYKNWDITDIAKGWMDDPESNHGILVRMIGESYKQDQYGYWYSKEGHNFHPMLIVTYTSSIQKANLFPTGDSYISGHTSYQNRNYGSGAGLYVGDPGISSSRGGARTLIYWDFASELPADTKIQSATLNIFVDYLYPLGSRNIYFHKLTESWVENQVTWKRPKIGSSWNGGTYDSNPFISWYTSGNIHEWRTWDLTELVKDWVENPSENHGMIIRLEGIGNYKNRQFGVFNSKEANSFQPFLKLAYKSDTFTTIVQPGVSKGKDNYMYHRSNNGRYDTSNYGSFTNVYTRYYWRSSYTYMQRGLLEFANTELTKLQIPCAVVSKAELYLYGMGYSYRFAYPNVDVYDINVPWTEMSSSWRRSGSGTNWNGCDPNNSDYVKRTTPSYTFGTESGSKWYKVDITNSVIDWIANPNDNHGLLFSLSNEGQRGSGSYSQSYWRFYSSEYNTKGFRPYLKVTFTSGGVDELPPETKMDLPKGDGYYKIDKDNYWAQPNKKFSFRVEDDMFGEGMKDGGYTMYKIENSAGTTITDWKRVDATSDIMEFNLDVLTIEDKYKITFYSVDKLGNIEEENVKYITIDNTVPGIPQVNFGTPYHEGSIFITPQTTLEIDGAIDFGGNGNPAGCTKGHGYWSINKGVTWTKVDSTFKIPNEGDHTVWFRGTDNVGNSNPENYFELDITVDATPPTTKNIVVDPFINGFVSIVSEFTIPSGTDNCGGDGTPVGIDRTEYRIDNGEWNTINLNTPFSINMMQGFHTLYYRSVDYLENAETAKILDIVVDNSPPPQSKLNFKDLKGPKLYDNYNLDIYVSANTEFKLITPNNDYPDKTGMSVGYDYSEYLFSGGPNPTNWIRYTDTITIPKSILKELGDGRYDFIFRSVDKLGNTYETAMDMETIRYNGEKKYSMVFDNTPPETEAMTPATNDECKGNWYDGSLYVTSEKKLYDSYATYFKMGESKDPIINNYGTGVKKVEWAVDLPNTDTDDLIWIEWEDYETVTRAIREYEIARYLMGEPLDITEGNWSIYYRAWDMLNNIEETKHLDVTVDDSPPTSDYEILADGKVLTDDELDYYAIGVDSNEFFAGIDFEYKLSSKDLPGDSWMNAGLKMIEYKILDENIGQYIHSWKEYEGPFTLPGDGKYVIYYRGIDNLNHHENELSFTIYVDTIAPSKPDIEVGLPSHVDLTNYFLKVNTGEMKTPFKITNLNDPNPSTVSLASGIVKAEYRVDDGEWMDSFLDVFYPEGTDKDHTIYARAIDKVGNVGEIQEKVLSTSDDLLYATVVFDSTAPTTEIITFTVTTGESGSVKLAWEVANKNFYHLNIYRSSIIVPGEWDYIDTVGNTVTKYTDIPENDGSYRYKIAPADEVENEATGKISTENIILVSGRNREFQVPTNPGPYEPYVRVLMKTISSKATISAELLNSLPNDVDTPEGSDFTFWDINDGSSGGTRAALEAELYFYYGHLRLTSDMEDYMRVIYWDGHKWSDFAERNIDKINDEIMVTTTHFSIYGVARAYSDLEMDVSVKSNPNLAGKQNLIYADVTNYGKAQGRLFDVDEKGANVTFAIKNAEGGWTDLGYEINDIMAGETKTVTMVWDNTEVSGRDGVDIEVRVVPKDSKTETDPENNFANENVEVLETAIAITSFVTSIVILAISTIVVVGLSYMIKKRK